MNLEQCAEFLFFFIIKFIVVYERFFAAASFKQFSFEFFLTGEELAILNLQGLP